ncbi:type II toxin-antitoxin system RelB family antitoxin [Loigolactobacillus iwatensis]|uniref:type II toxin-antitoxin system RelB family antitoxin n=1 Tax=Loigolactobacillus iwatensis TaxID=1267156 RepID=UPI000F7EBA2D|nr:DUF6290 family protein [Loigolactobacillus iwatensis]
MAVIRVQVDAAEKEWLQYLAGFHGVSLSDLIKEYSIAQLEDEYDRQTAAIAMKRWREDGRKTVSMQEILAKFGGL